MRTAIGLYRAAQEHAGWCRRLATRAAAAGRQRRACHLTERAQRYDERAAEWREAVPRWQWKDEAR
jgi:hypothetical protein